MRRGKRGGLLAQRAFGVWLVVLAGCGGAPAVEARSPFVLRARAGTYSDGSGRLALAVVASVRTAEGGGPDGAWVGTLSEPGGRVVASGFRYDAPGAGSLATWWFPDVPVRAGASYVLRLEDGEGEGLAQVLDSMALDPLDVPGVRFSGDGLTLAWEPVPRAAAYLCRVVSGGQVHLHVESTGPTCDVSALPAGAYSASVFALSLDLSALRAGEPVRNAFHVSEARLAFSRGADGTTSNTLAAAGGVHSYGGSSPGLSVWARLATPSGGAPEAAWQVEVVGPGLPAASPLRFQYPAAAPQVLVWSYDVAPASGTYGLTARSGEQALTAQFTTGTAPALGAPLDVVVESAASGGARVSWRAPAGARSFFVGVWRQATGQFVRGLWVGETAYAFPSQSFEPGVTYDVYVTASNVDMSSSVVPAQVATAEDGYLPQSFTAR